jgi:rhomboid protease GluP
MSEDLTNTGPANVSQSNAMISLPPTMIASRIIVIANVAVLGIMVAGGMSFVSPDGRTLLNWGANFSPFTLNGQWWRLVTHMFLHFGIVHIGMNMWILWGLARLVERLVGSVGFGIAYMVSGIAGGITSLAWNPVGVSAGASGAVFGTAGVLLGFVVLRKDTIPTAVRNQMLKSMATFLILNLVVGMSVPQIDMAAHAGGFIGGVICGLILSQPLSPGILARRKFRNLIVVMAAAVILPLAIVALPQAPIREQDDSKIQRAYQSSQESKEKLKDEINSSDGKQ